MDECRITYNGYALVTAGFVSFVHAVERRDGCAHADAGVHHAERSHRAERIAADITADIDLELLEGIEQTSVRTSGAKYGWTRGNVYIGLEISVLFTEDNFLYHALRILAEKRELFLADDIYSELAAVIFYVRVKLFDDIDFFAFCRKVTDYLFGQRIEAAYLEIRRFIAESLFGILVGNSASDYADFLVVIFNLVDAEVNSFAVAPGFESLCSLFNYDMLLLCHGGHHDIFLCVLDILLESVVDSLPYLNKAAGMRDSRSESDYNRSVVTLGDIICKLRESETLLRIRRLEHRYL